MAENIKFSFEVPVYPERVFRSWLDGGEQSRITGRKARVEAQVGGKFSFLDDQVQGEILVMTPHDTIVQTWQDKAFPASTDDTQVELRFEPTCTGTELTLVHTGIPDGFSRQVMDRWEQELFRPMLKYFEELVGDYTADMSDG
jgi:activator of HSP90 ATPase